MKIDYLLQLCSAGSHNAFTDLCLFNNLLYCCFRQARNHVSDDGIIKIFTLSLKGKVLNKSCLSVANCDLRDPKLTVTPDGKLMLIAYARRIHSGAPALPSQNLSWLSADGLSWSSTKSFAKDNWWLWRIRWHQSQAYGFAYNRAANAIDLYQGNPRRTFQTLVPGALSLQKHQLPYPNESDLLFKDGRCYAIVRRDAGSYSAQLGHSHFPFRKWYWTDLGFYLGGPVMQLLRNDTAMVAGRVIHKNKLRTVLFQLHLTSGKVSDKLFLPSGGDNSYPGMVLTEETLYLSYYSSHIDKKSQIYLAKITLT